LKGRNEETEKETKVGRIKKHINKLRKKQTYNFRKTQTHKFKKKKKGQVPAVLGT
jgi:hypothetical protein